MRVSDTRCVIQLRAAAATRATIIRANRFKLAESMMALSMAIRTISGMATALMLKQIPAAADSSIVVL